MSRSQFEDKICDLKKYNSLCVLFILAEIVVRRNLFRPCSTVWCGILLNLTISLHFPVLVLLLFLQSIYVILAKISLSYCYHYQRNAND